MSENAQAEPLNSPAGGTPIPGFFEEAADLWRRLPHKVLFLILLGAWIALFHVYGNATLGYAPTSSLFIWALSIYRAGEDEAHGQYIPYAVLIFLWLKRKELRQIAPLIWWPGVVYFAGALLLHLAGFRMQQARVSVLAFILGLHALIALIWGRDALRRTVFPVFLLLFCIPFGSWADPITFNLRLFVTKVAVGIAHTGLGISVFREGSQILGPAGHALYDVAPACSGMRSLIAMSALSVIYAFLNFDTVWRRLVLIASALPLAIFANIVRITTVIIIGDTWGQRYGALIEQKFGFVTFAIAIGGMMAIGWFLRERRSERTPKVEQLEEAKAI
jgi:exosortase